MSEVIVVADQCEAGELVAEHIVAMVAATPRFVLGLATGASPVPVYRALAARVASGLDLAAMRCFALDEYVGLPPDHPQSYHAVIAREVTMPLGLDPANVSVPDGSLAGIEAAGDRYEAAIVAAGGVDLQLLGIGANGHVGFNEPGSSLASRTRIKTLTQRTRQDNACYFGSLADVPVHCITQGIGTIAQARHLVLLAFGANKARAVAAALEGPVTASVPASVIQLHPHATVIVDEGAAVELQQLDYYRLVRKMKPSWQGL